MGRDPAKRALYLMAADTSSAPKAVNESIHPTPMLLGGCRGNGWELRSTQKGFEEGRSRRRDSSTFCERKDSLSPASTSECLLPKSQCQTGTVLSRSESHQSPVHANGAFRSSTSVDLSCKSDATRSGFQWPSIGSAICHSWERDTTRDQSRNIKETSPTNKSFFLRPRVR